MRDVIGDKEKLRRIEHNLDEVDLAVVELLKHRWSGKIGMFHVFALDYLVGKDEQVWILEVNKQPDQYLDAVTTWWPDLWPEVLKIEWEILSTIGEDPSEKNLKKLRENLKAMDLKAFRMLKV
jgi:hypothetical protein